MCILAGRGYKNGFEVAIDQEGVTIDLQSSNLFPGLMSRLL